MHEIMRSPIIKFTDDSFHYRCLYQNDVRNTCEVREITLKPNGEGLQETVHKGKKQDLTLAVQSLIAFKQTWQENALKQKITGPIFLSAHEIAHSGEMSFDTPCYIDAIAGYNVQIDTSGKAYSTSSHNVTDSAEFRSVKDFDIATDAQKDAQKITPISTYFNQLADKISTEHLQQELQSGRKIEDIKVEEFTDHILDLTIGIEDTLNMAMKYIGTSATEILDINERISDQMTSDALKTLHGKTAQLYLIEQMIEAGQKSYMNVVDGAYDQIEDLEALKSAITNNLDNINMAGEARNCHDLMTTNQKISEQGFFANRMQSAFENAIQKQKDTGGTDGQKVTPFKQGAMRHMRKLMSFGKGT